MYLFLHINLSGIVWYFTQIVSVITLILIMLITIIACKIKSNKSGKKIKTMNGYALFRGAIPALLVNSFGLILYPDFFSFDTRKFLDDLSVFYVVFQLLLLLFSFSYYLSKTHKSS